jgi:tRNA pseudouridine38-40 synthase
MHGVCLCLGYDGTDFHGWQAQPGLRTVQGMIEEAIDEMGIEHSAVRGCSRTDAGVHALGQVASLTLESDVPASAIGRALNGRLPADIRVVGVVDAAPGFHARYHARSKSYRYRIATTPVLSPFDRLYVWHSDEPRDVGAMAEAATFVVGRHDFAAFQGARSAVRHTVRTVTRCEVREAGGEIVIEVDGDGFLRHMVRIIVGTLAEVGGRQRAPASVADVLAARDRRAAGPTAPAAGLTLLAVRYPPLC